MRMNVSARRIFTFALIGIGSALVLFCLGTVLVAYFFPIPPKLLLFSPPPPAVLDFAQVDEIIIDDAWVGLALFTSYENQYILKNDQGQFKGTANFSVGVHDPIQSSVPLEVSAEEVKRFTTLLAQSKLERGIYMPNITHTDDNPRIVIALKDGSKEVAIFSTTSQGKSHSPWEVAINGNSYIVQSDLPAAALDALKKNLRQDIFESLLEQAKKGS